MKLLITGVPGVGKSTLINRLVAESERKIYGFRTKREGTSGNGSVFIYPASCGPEPRLVATVNPEHTERFPDEFDAAAKELLADIPSGGLVIMDELGFLENRAEIFKRRVLEVMSGPYDIICAVKPRSTPFLDQVRGIPEVELFEVTEENRDDLAILLRTRFVQRGESV